MKKPKAVSRKSFDNATIAVLLLLYSISVMFSMYLSVNNIKHVSTIALLLAIVRTSIAFIMSASLIATACNPRIGQYESIQTSFVAAILPVIESNVDYYGKLFCPWIAAHYIITLGITSYLITIRLKKSFFRYSITSLIIITTSSAMVINTAMSMNNHLIYSSLIYYVSTLPYAMYLSFGPILALRYYLSRDITALNAIACVVSISFVMWLLGLIHMIDLIPKVFITSILIYNSSVYDSDINDLDSETDF